MVVIVFHWRDGKKLPNGWEQNQQIELSYEELVDLGVRYDLMLIWREKWLLQLDDQGMKFRLC